MSDSDQLLFKVILWVFILGPLWGLLCYCVAEDLRLPKWRWFWLGFFLNLYAVIKILAVWAQKNRESKG